MPGDHAPGRRATELTGNPVLTGFTAPKLLWVRRHEADVYARVASVLLPRDYVRYRLCGERLSDVSDASGTSRFDVGGRRWSDEMLSAREVPRDWLPAVSESPVPSARLDASAAGQTGLRTGTPIVAGAGDQAARAVGAGIVAPGEMSVTLGTSGVVFAACDRFRPDPLGRLHAFCHAVPGAWHLMGVMLAAGGSLEWVSRVLGEPPAVLAERAGRVSPGSEGLVFLPYLSGERTPHADPRARGAFIGLSVRHTKAQLARAVLEGVAFALRDSLELMGKLGVVLRRIRVSGGGARSALWRQILADVFETEIVTVPATAGAAYGAALLAGAGAGVFSCIGEAARVAIRAVESHVPGRAALVCTALYRRFRALYPALREEFGALSELTGRA